MKTKILILTVPQSWTFTDEKTGVVRSGCSAHCFLPEANTVLKVSNLPAGLTAPALYDCECGFKQVTDHNGKNQTALTVNDVINSTCKRVDFNKL